MLHCDYGDPITNNRGSRTRIDRESKFSGFLAARIRILRRHRRQLTTGDVVEEWWGIHPPAPYVAGAELAEAVRSV